MATTAFQKIRHAFSRQGLVWQQFINNTEIHGIYNHLTQNGTDGNSQLHGKNTSSSSSRSSSTLSNHHLESNSESDPILLFDPQTSRISEIFFTFITSKYCLTLIIVAFVSNRITHICRPNGRPRPIPILTRLTILLPSLVSLSYVVFRFFQEIQISHSLNVVGSDAGQQKDIDALKVGDGDQVLFFRALLAASLSTITETLLRNLEASHSEPTSFNLFSWAVLLHQSLSLESPSNDSSASKLLKSTSYRPSFLARLSGTAVRTRSNPVPSFSNTNLLTSRSQLFFHLSVVLAEILILNILDIFSRRNSRWRLPISSVFGFIGISQYLWNLSHNQRFSFDWSISRFWELVILSLIVLTAGLNLLTQFILARTSNPPRGEARSSSNNFNFFPLNRFLQLDFSRMFFHPSNFPSLQDDFGTALFKLGASCLKTTRINGMQNEVIEIKTLETTYLETAYVEIAWKDGFGDQAQVKGGKENPFIEYGLKNEIKTIRGDGFQDQNEQESNTPWWDSSISETLFLTPTRIRSIKNFLVEFYLFFRNIAVLLYNGFMNLSLVRRILNSDQAYRIRTISSKVFKWCRLLWHGTKGERERDLRIQAQELNRIREEKQAEDLRKVAENRRHWLSALAQNSRRPSGFNSIHTIEDDDEEEDGDWQDDDSDQDGGVEGDEEGIRERIIFSPTPAPEEFEVEPDSNSLIQLARFDFGSENEKEIQGQGTGNIKSNRLNPILGSSSNYTNNINSSSNFSDIFLAHFSNQSSSPLTRRSYQKKFNQNLNPSTTSTLNQSQFNLASTSTSSSSSSSIPNDVGFRGASLNQNRQLMDRNRRMMQEDQRRDLIEVMRARRIPINDNAGASGSLDYEKERLRTCVVCITEERTILLWPCRCLALCEGCRDSLASRPGSNSLTGVGAIICPCCRTPIQGYSRLFLP